MNTMYISLAHLIACSLLMHGDARSQDTPGAPARVGTVAQSTVAAASVTLQALLVQEPEPGQAKPPAGEAEPADEGGAGPIPMAQQIVAGALTGMLAAILTLRLVFYWRRKKEPR